MKQISGKRKSLYAFIFLTLAIMALGISLGGFSGVMRNAIIICLDCIGLF
ncbi:MAG: hypothetical protein PHO53_00135 [Actinomycetota bacterium]|nr:hypothetical protein [Actinomycetota bacterium]